MSEVTEQAAARADGGEPVDDLQTEALRRLEKKREFHVHAVVFVLVNALFWLIWGVVYAYTGSWFPWPLFPLMGWGIGLSFHAWEAYGKKPFSRAQIEREAARLRAAR